MWNKPALLLRLLSSLASTGAADVSYQSHTRFLLGMRNKKVRDNFFVKHLFFFYAINNINNFQKLVINFVHKMTLLVYKLKQLYMYLNANTIWQQEFSSIVNYWKGHTIHALGKVICSFMRHTALIFLPSIIGSQKETLSTS